MSGSEWILEYPWTIERKNAENEANEKAVLLMMVLTMTGCTSAKPKDTSAQPEEQQSFTQPTASAEENSNKTVFAAKADLGKLDEHPKRFQDQGWIIKKDGLYG